VGLSAATLHDIEDPLRPPLSPVFDEAHDLLVTYLHGGQVVHEPDPVEVARARAARELSQLSPRARRFLNPQPYPVGLDPHVHLRKQQLIAEARERTALASRS
jgi:Nicotinate phosphoribosyltransferase C-terminal domain